MFLLTTRTLRAATRSPADSDEALWITSIVIIGQAMANETGLPWALAA